MTHDPKIERCIEAFQDGTGGCVRHCECGHVYYDGDLSYSWDKGELEALNSNPDATDCGFTVCTLSFGGVTYVEACDCWHDPARKMMAWLDGHAHKVARYLNGEKAAAVKAANAMPDVHEQNT